MSLAKRVIAAPIRFGEAPNVLTVSKRKADLLIDAVPVEVSAPAVNVSINELKARKPEDRG